MRFFSLDAPEYLPVFASMGASAFLLFVVPHSPMAQPWPVLGGHLISAAIALIIMKWIEPPALAAATAITLSIFSMNQLRCLHPPSAATVLILTLNAHQVQLLGWPFYFGVVAINVGLILLLALIINNFIFGRRYPTDHSHLPSLAQAMTTPSIISNQLTEDDFKWALEQMDGMVDVSVEDMVDMHKLALKHSQRRK